MFRLAFLVAVVFLVLVSCAPQAESGPTSSPRVPEIVSVEATKVKDGDWVEYRWRVEPNNASFDTWLWVWTESPERPDSPELKTQAFGTSESTCDPDVEGVSCPESSPDAFEFRLPAGQDRYEGTYYFQVFVGTFNDGGQRWRSTRRARSERTSTLERVRVALSGAGSLRCGCCRCT
ncbi:MAG: hypothetical protein LC667_18320 [Thioalkalivibrio sp.]|nr:hypothetical protein [Thioalkalivibrio sp.]